MGPLRMPPLELHMAAHLHPLQSTLSSRNPAIAIARAPNMLSLLTTYQAELRGEFAASHSETSHSPY